MSNKARNKIRPLEDDSLSLLDCSILDSSNGEKLALYLRRKKGITKNTRLFGDYAPAPKSPKRSFPIEVIRKSPVADIPSDKAANLPQQSDKVNLIGHSPKRNLVVSLKRMSTNTLTRKTLVKEFEKTVRENDFHPPASSTPIQPEFNQLGLVPDGISPITNPSIIPTPKVIQNCAEPQNGMLNEVTLKVSNQPGCNSASSSNREVLPEPNKAPPEVASPKDCNNTTKPATTQTSNRAQIRSKRRSRLSVFSDNSQHCKSNDTASKIKKDGGNKQVFSPARNIEVSYHSINKPELQDRNDNVFNVPEYSVKARSKSIAKPPESAKLVTETANDMVSKQPMIVIPINQTFYSQSPNKNCTSTEKTPAVAASTQITKTADMTRTKDPRSCSSPLTASDDSESPVEHRGNKRKSSKRLTTNSKYALTSDSDAENQDREKHINNRAESPNEIINRKKSYTRHQRTEKNYELTSDEDDETNFQRNNNNYSNHRRSCSKQADHQKDKISISHHAINSRNSNPFDLRLGKDIPPVENSQKSPSIECRNEENEVLSDETIPETQPLTANNTTKRNASIMDNQPQSKKPQSKRCSSKILTRDSLQINHKNVSDVYQFNPDSSPSSTSSEDSLLADFDENLIPRNDCSDLENFVTDRSPRSQRVWADSIFKPRSKKSEKPRFKRGQRMVNKISDPLMVTVQDIEAALKKTANTNNKKSQRRKLFSLEMMENQQENSSQESTLIRDNIYEEIGKSIRDKPDETRDRALLKDKQNQQEQETPSQLSASAINTSSSRSLIQTVKNILDEGNAEKRETFLRTTNEMNSILTTKTTEPNLFKVPKKPAPKSIKKFLKVRKDLMDSSTNSTDNEEDIELNSYLGNKNLEEPSNEHASMFNKSRDQEYINNSSNESINDNFEKNNAAEAMETEFKKAKPHAGQKKKKLPSSEESNSRKKAKIISDKNENAVKRLGKKGKNTNLKAISESSAAAVSSHQAPESESSDSTTFRRSNRKRHPPIAYWTNTRDQMVFLAEPQYRESPPLNTKQFYNSKKYLRIKKAIQLEKAKLSAQSKNNEKKKAVVKKNFANTQKELEENHGTNFVDDVPTKSQSKNNEKKKAGAKKNLANTQKELEENHGTNFVDDVPTKSQSKNNEKKKAVAKKNLANTQKELEENQGTNFVDEVPTKSQSNNNEKKKAVATKNLANTQKELEENQGTNFVDEVTLPLVEERDISPPIIVEPQPSTSSSTISEPTTKKKFKKTKKKLSNISEETNQTKTDSHLKYVSSKKNSDAQTIQEEESIVPITETPKTSKSSAKVNENKRTENQTINDSGNATATATISQTLQTYMETHTSKQKSLEPHLTVTSCHFVQTDPENHVWLQKIVESSESTNPDVPQVCKASKVCVVPSAGSMCSAENLNFKNVEGVEFAFYTSEGNENCGYMRFRPNTIKKKKKSKHYQLKFLALSGYLECFVGERIFKMIEGNFLTIEKGANYEIRNTTDKSALLFFIKS